MANPRIRSFSRRQVVALLGVGLAAGVACGPPPPTPAPPPTAKPPAPTAAPPQPTAATKPAAPTAVPTAVPTPKALTKVRLGEIANIFDNAYAIIGIQKGFYREEGIDLEEKNFQDGATMVRAMVADELDAAEIGVQPMVPAVIAGGDLKVVGSVRPKLNLLLYARKEIGRPEDLYGKTIGTGAVGSALHSTLVAFFQEKNLDLGKVEVASIGSAPSVFAAVAAGKVDAGVAGFEFTSVLKDNPDIKVLVDFAEALPIYQRTSLVVHGRLVQKPDVVLGLMTGMARSVRYGIEHKEEIVRYGVEVLKRKREEIEYGHDYDVQHRLLAPDLDFDPRSIEYLQRLNVQAGSQREILPFDRVATLEYQQKVVAKLGKYQWKS